MKNPTHQLPASDVGARTLRNYSYQSIYGVVLLCGAAAGKNEYTAIWCEQEDDLLAQITDDLFDSYQVKTRIPELGYWDITFTGFVDALRVFLRLETQYPHSIRYYNFVCEAVPLNTQDKKKVHKCPLRLLEDVRTAPSVDHLNKSTKKGLASLAGKLGVSAELLLPVLKRLRLTPEPIRKEAAIDVLVGTHLPLVPCCSAANQAKLRRAAVDVIGQVDEASRLSNQAPERHYACLDPVGKSNPQLLGKRVPIDAFVKRCRETVQPAFSLCRRTPRYGRCENE